jgi:ATP-binding cassette subfamily C exporter for protease/lipase
MTTSILDTKRSELGNVVRSFRAVFLAVGAFSFVINVLLLVPSIYMLQIYDRVLTSRNETTLLTLTIVMAGLYVLEAALEFVRSRVLVRASAALDVSLSSRVFNASFDRSLQGRGGSPVQAIGDLTNVRQFLTSQGLFAFFDSPWTPIYLVVIFLLSPWLGIFALAGALILALMAYITERLTGPALAEAIRCAISANAYAAGNLRNAEAIEAMGMLGRLRERWSSRQNRFLALQAQASDRAASIGAATKFFRLFLQSGILGLGALLVIENQMSAGGMIAASILMGRALMPVELGISSWRGFVSARSAYARLDELLQAHPARRESLSLPRPAGVVSAENLVVAAPGKREPILKGIGFQTAAGRLVAIVGPSGSGKSTLARALVGIWKPLSGAVRLDGADVHDWNKEELGPWIGFLPQGVELMDGTVAENIARFGSIDSERIVSAARQAGVHELILRLPHGYDTPIGENGIILSGGQRQRVALARALYADPALVVLDEPNANLDEAGDAALMKALQQMKQEGRTAFVITHRTNVLNIADEIMVIVDGSIQIHGPRDQVAKALMSKLQPPAGPSGPVPAQTKAMP